MKKSYTGILLIALSLMILAVSAFVYDQASQTTTQTIINVASLTLNSADLGDIDEGETIYYTPANTTAVDNVLSLTTARSNVYLHFDTDLQDQATYYDTYQIEVVVSSAPMGSSLSGTVATLTIGSPDTSSGIDLDAAGNYVFDFQVTTTAKGVSTNQATTVNITVTAEDVST